MLNVIDKGQEGRTTWDGGIIGEAHAVKVHDSTPCVEPTHHGLYAAQEGLRREERR